MFSYFKELTLKFSLKEKMFHYAYSYFLRTLNHFPRASNEELGDIAVAASILAIKIHDVDENNEVM